MISTQILVFKIVVLKAIVVQQEHCIY